MKKNVLLEDLQNRLPPLINRTALIRCVDALTGGPPFTVAELVKLADPALDVADLMKAVAPAPAARMETGPVQFGPDDWPGIFIRGDQAFQFAFTLQGVLDADRDSWTFIETSILRGLAVTLASCRVPVENLVMAYALNPERLPLADEAGHNASPVNQTPEPH